VQSDLISDCTFPVVAESQLSQEANPFRLPCFLIILILSEGETHIENLIDFDF
jgi:hypothetical protein